MEKLVEALKIFGLSEYEAKVLLALIAKGELTAKEIAEFSGVPRTSVYDVIKSLINKGLVEAYGKPMKFKALNSDELMRIFSKKVEENLRYLKEELPTIEKAKTEEVKIYRGEIAMVKVAELISNSGEIVIAASFIPDEIVSVLKKSNADVTACAANIEDLEGLRAKLYKVRFETRAKHGIILADGKTVAIFFKNGQTVVMMSSGKGFVEFYRMFLDSIFGSDLIKPYKQ